VTQQVMNSISKAGYKKISLYSKNKFGGLCLNEIKIEFNFLYLALLPKL